MTAPVVGDDQAPATYSCPGGATVLLRRRALCMITGGTSIARKKEVCSLFGQPRRRKEPYGMRIGLMVGPERGRYGTKVAAAPGRRPVGGGGRAGHRVDPPDPRRVRRPHRRHRGRRRDLPHRDRHGGGTRSSRGIRSPWPSRSSRSRPCARGAWPSASASRTTGSSTRCSACPTSTRWPPCAPTSTCSTRPCPGPGPVDVENERFRVHNPLDVTDVTPTPVLLAALGPRMLQLCGERSRRDHPVDGRRTGHRHLRRARPDPCLRGGRPAGPPGGGRHTGLPVRRPRDRRRRGPDQPDPRPRPRSRPTTRGCSTRATPGASATSWPPAASRRSGSACRVSPTPG